MCLYTLAAGAEFVAICAASFLRKRFGRAQAGKEHCYQKPNTDTYYDSL
tara:strand:+ start:13296 stop:13442 length:147 start_codon:yes stop_codon:yes gene_type:complete